MSEFEQKMRRLKDALRLTHDQEVATALGMTKASLSDRKRRDSFPIERVIGLAGRHLGLDVAYVVTGLTEEERERARHRDVVAEGRSLPGDQEASASDVSSEQQAAMGARLRKEVVLGTLLSWCTDDDLDLMLQLAARLGSTKRQRAYHREVVDTILADRLSPTTGVLAVAGKEAATAGLIEGLPGSTKVLIVKARDDVAGPAAKAARKSARKTIKR